MKKFMEEFKAFAMRGNVIDMAVGVIIGGAFKAIADSLVNDIINPPLASLPAATPTFLVSPFPCRAAVN